MSEKTVLIRPDLRLIRVLLRCFISSDIQTCPMFDPVALLSLRSMTMPLLYRVTELDQQQEFAYIPKQTSQDGIQILI